MTGRLSEMTPAATLTGAELVELTQSTNTRRTTVRAIADLASVGTPTVINAMSDYGAVGDGVTNDRTAIQNALNAASAAGGGVVYIPEATYIVGTAGLAGTMLSIPAEVTLRGEGRKASIIKSASTINGHQVLQFAASASHARVESLGIDANSSTTSSAGVSGATTSHCVVEDVWIAAKFGWGVFFGTNSMACRVVGCVIDGTTLAHGVEINGCSYCVIDDCYIGSTGVGNCIELYDTVSYRVVGTRITNNTLVGSVAGSGNTSGILTAGDIGTVIEHNHLINCDLYGIGLQASAYDSTRYAREVSVTGNVVKGSNRAGGATGVMLTSGARYNTVTGNTVESTALGGSGIQIDGPHNTITGNTCTLNGGSGIFVNTTAPRSVITNNVCVDNSGTGVGSQHGLVIQADYCKVIGNIGADTRGGSARQYYGVFIYLATGCVVIGNGGTGNLNGMLGDAGVTTTKAANESGTTYLPGLLIGSEVQAWDADLDAIANNGGAQAPMVSGMYYPAPQTGVTSTIAPTLNLMYLVRLPRPGGRGISGVGVEVVVGNSGGGVIRFGLYSDVGGIPTTLLVDLGLGVGAPDTPGVFHGATANYAAGSSPLWLAMVPQTSITSMTLRSVTAPGGWGSSAGLSAARGEGGFTQASVSGALPGTATIGSKIVGNMPVVVAQAT